jgi:hypothetical protein
VYLQELPLHLIGWIRFVIVHWQLLAALLYSTCATAC